MPKKYRVTEDGVTVLEKYAERRNRSTNETYDLNRATVYNEGDVLTEDRIAPGLLEQLQSGEGNLVGKLEEVKEEETSKKPTAKKKAVKSKSTETKSDNE